MTWNITPNINWDLQLKPPDYPLWRPTGGKTEKDVSEGILGVNVFVVDKDTGEPTANISVDGWTVELKDVSHSQACP